MTLITSRIFLLFILSLAESHVHARGCEQAFVVPINETGKKEHVIKFQGNLGDNGPVLFWRHFTNVSWSYNSMSYQVKIVQGERMYSVYYDDPDPIHAELNPKITFSMNENGRLIKLCLSYLSYVQTKAGILDEASWLTRLRIAKKKQVEIQDYIIELQKELKSRGAEFVITSE